MREEFKSWIPVLIFLFFLVFVGIAIGEGAEAQTPDPDVPFVPYTHIQEVDFEQPPETCVEEVIIEERTFLHGYCSKEIPTERGPDGQAIWMALPPDCMMVLLTKEKKTFEDGTLGLVENYEYHRNPECWILFKNIQYMEGKEDLIGA